MLIKISVFLFHAVFVAHCTGLCTDRFVDEREVSTEGNDRLEHERQIIIPQLRFLCNGRITRLIVGTDDETGKRNGGPNPIIFQIWRPTGATTYGLFGMIEVPEGVRVAGNPDDFLLVNFSIPTGNNLFFHDGDVVGYYQPDDLRAKIWTVRNNSYPAYRLRVNNYTTIFDTSSGLVEVKNDRQPSIHVIYESVCLKPNVQYGFVNCSLSDDTDTLVAVGGRCNIQCNVGYKPQDTGVIHCLSNGSWSHQVECAQIMCPPYVMSSPLVNVNCNGTVFNSVCILSCQNGGVPFESFLYVCNNSAKWEPIDNEINCDQIIRLSTVSSITTTTTTTAATTSTTTAAAASIDHVTFITTTVSVFGSTVPSLGFKSSANGGAIAGGVIAAILVLIGLSAVIIVLLWQYRKRLAGFLYMNVPSTNHGIRNSTYMDRDVKSDNFYYSIDKSDTIFKQHATLSTTIYDNADLSQCHVAKKSSDKSAPELPPQRQPVKNSISVKTDTDGDYEYVSTSHNHVTAKSVNSVLPPKISKTVSSDYSKNVQNKQDIVHCNPYEEAITNEESIYEDPGTSKETIYAYFERKKFRKISARNLRVDHKIGSGQFGTVHLGLWSSGSTDPIQVAVKTLNSQCSESDRVKFLREAAIMGQFVHNNVVQLHGVVTEEENMMIVLEYMLQGDLREYLSEIRSAKNRLFSDTLPEILLSFCRQIAAGMNYLANKQFVHRDLAARNILVSSDDVCKIADFGMARDVADSNYYVTTGGKVPVKWTAPEALLYQKYSVYSDVWSYGCVLYEIWSIGHIPFEDVTGSAAVQKISHGYRLPPPPGCPKAIYQLMINCWHGDPKRRPLFSKILMDLQYDQANLLSWSIEDLGMAASDATVLGGSLSAGKNLFVLLQNTYKLI